MEKPNKSRAIGIAGQDNGLPYAFVMAHPAGLRPQMIYPNGDNMLVGTGNQEYVATAGKSFNKLGFYDDSTKPFLTLDDIEKRWLTTHADMHHPASPIEFMLMGLDKDDKLRLDKATLHPGKTKGQKTVLDLERGLDNFTLFYAGIDKDKIDDFWRSEPSYDGVAASFDAAYRFAAEFMSYFGADVSGIQFGGLSVNGRGDISGLTSFPEGTGFASEELELEYLRSSVGSESKTLTKLRKIAAEDRQRFEEFLLEIMNSKSH